MFYGLCGGAVLFAHADHPVWIVEPDEFRRINPLVAGVERTDDISDRWYVIAREGSETSNASLISMDCDPARAGRCYDSYWEVHAIAGSSTVVALSFTELLQRLLDRRGGRPYWLDGSVGYGDAYDTR